MAATTTARAPVFELTNLSFSQLRRLADLAAIDTGTHPTKLDILQALITLDPADLEQLAEDYLYAGRTSISWFRVRGVPFNVQAVRRALETVEERDVFDTPRMPADVTTTPHLIEASHWRPNKVVVHFVARKREVFVLQNGRFVPHAEDEAFVFVMRLDKNVIEARCSNTRVHSMRDWLGEFGKAIGEHPAQVEFDRSVMDELQRTLRGRLSQYTGKETGGAIYDTRSMSKSEMCNDLAVEPRFKSDTASLAPVTVELLYVSQVANEQVRLLVGLRGHSVYFRTMSSEPIIDEVFEAVREVKGF